MGKTRISFHQVSIRNHGEIEIDHVEAGWVNVFETDMVGTSGIEPEWLLRYVVVEPLPDENDTPRQQTQGGIRPIFEQGGDDG